jgi:hypothetical protein
MGTPLALQSPRQTPMAMVHDLDVPRKELTGGVWPCVEIRASNPNLIDPCIRRVWRLLFGSRTHWRTHTWHWVVLRRTVASLKLLSTTTWTRLVSADFTHQDMARII